MYEVDPLIELRHLKKFPHSHQYQFCDLNFHHRHDFAARFRQKWLGPPFKNSGATPVFYKYLPSRPFKENY